MGHRAPVDHDLPRIVQRYRADLKQILRVGGEHLDRAHELSHRVQLFARAVHLFRQAVGNIVRIKTERVEDGAYRFQRIRDLADDGAVYLLLHGGLRLVRYLRRDGVFLFVLVILDLRVDKVAVKYAEKVLCKVLGHDERGVIVARVEPVHGLLARVHKAPAHLVVALYAVDDHLADVQLKPHKLAALVLRCDDDLDVRR